MQKARGQAPSRSRERPPTACKRTVSGTISLPALGFFSPFPHGTCSLSVASEYLALEDGPPSFPRDSTCPAVLGNGPQRDRCVSDKGLSPSPVVLSRIVLLRIGFLTLRAKPRSRPTTPPVLLPTVCALPFSLTATGGISLISHPAGTEMYHFPAFAPRNYPFIPG